MKTKKHIWLPLVLLVYLAFMTYYTYPGRHADEGVGYTQYYLTLGITFVLIIALSFFLKKKEENKQKYKNKNKKVD